MVDKPYSRTYTQPRAVYCQAFNRHLAPGGAERRRLCSMVVSGGSGAAVTKSLEGKGAQVPREGDVFFLPRQLWKDFWGSVFLVGEKHLELERKRTLRGLSELDCKGMNDFAACCEGLRFSQLVSAFSRIADDWWLVPLGCVNGRLLVTRKPLHARDLVKCHDESQGGCCPYCFICSYGTCTWVYSWSHNIT